MKDNMKKKLLKKVASKSIEHILNSGSSHVQKDILIVDKVISILEEELSALCASDKDNGNE